MALQSALVSALLALLVALLQIKKRPTPQSPGLTLSWYSLKRKSELYYKSIERRSDGVQINKRPVSSRAFVFPNSIL